MNKTFRSELTQSLKSVQKVVQYYRTGPLGDLAAVNGKIIEEAFRHVLTNRTDTPITTKGLVDLGVGIWDIGFQLKTHRKKQKKVIFSRSNKVGHEAKIEDLRERVLSSLTKTKTRHLVLIDYDVFTGEIALYHLASIIKGVVKTYGTFLGQDTTFTSERETHVYISVEGLKKLS